MKSEKDFSVFTFTPSSIMSSMTPSKVRPSTIPCGLFLLWVATPKREQSFLDVRNSREETSSKGRRSFFFCRILERLGPFSVAWAAELAGLA